MKYRVLWTVDDGRTMASEYASASEAEYHRSDIAGWIPNARIETVQDDSDPVVGPFEVKPSKRSSVEPKKRKTRYDHINNEDEEP